MNFIHQKPIHPGRTKAILRYEGSPKDDPLTSRSKCSPQTPCHILNCPYKDLPESDNSICIPVSNIRSYQQQVTFGIKQDDQSSKSGEVSSEEIEEHFLNFHFRGMKTEGIWRTTINGIANVLPPSPLQVSHHL